MVAVLEDRVREREQLSIVLRYTGPAVDDGTMDVYAVATNMMAFSNFVVAAAHRVYGNDVVVKAEVTAFRQGSFATDLLFQVVGAAATIWSITPDLGGLLTVMKESIDLFRFLEGKEPKAIEHRENNQTVHVTNNNGVVMTTNIESLTLTLDEKGADAVGAFIRDALDRSGVDAVQIQADSQVVAAVESRDAQFYHRISLDSTRTSDIGRFALTIEMPSFKDGNKWRFLDGEVSFPAAIQDAGFLQRVDNGEPFRKGDILLCMVRIEQYRVGSTLKSERTIVEVIEHRRGLGDQGNLEL